MAEKYDASEIKRAFDRLMKLANAGHLTALIEAEEEVEVDDGESGGHIEAAPISPASVDVCRIELFANINAGQTGSALVQKLCGSKASVPLPEEILAIRDTAVKLLSCHRQRTEMASRDVANLYLGYRYSAMQRSDTRALHLAMHGFVAVTTDPIWAVIWPPCGASCRCNVRGVRRGEAEAVGLVGTSGRPLLSRIFASPLQQDVVESAMAGLSIVVDGVKLRFPDAGFRLDELG